GAAGVLACELNHPAIAPSGDLPSSWARHRARIQVAPPTRALLPPSASSRSKDRRAGGRASLSLLPFPAIHPRSEESALRSSPAAHAAEKLRSLPLSTSRIARRSGRPS